MERVLVIRFGSLGDVVIASAVVEALHRMKERPGIVFLTKKRYAALFEGDSRLDRVVGTDKGDTPGAIVRAAGTEFDAVIDLHGTLRSRIVSVLVSAPVKTRVRKHALARRLMVWSRNRFRRRFDVLGSHMDTLRSLGVEGRVLPRLLPGPEALENADRLIAPFRKGSGRLIGIAPGSRHATKRWDARSWARLAILLAARGDVPLILGDDGDRAFAEEVRGLAETDIPSIAGEADLRTTVGVIAWLDCLVSNDSGPMHVAGALDTPFAAVFGPTHPDLGFAPGYPFGSILHAGLSCSPCGIHGEHPCRLGGRPCMSLISPDMVLTEADRMMSLRAAGRPGPDIPC